MSIHVLNKHAYSAIIASHRFDPSFHKCPSSIADIGPEPNEAIVVIDGVLEPDEIIPPSWGLS